jgi:hypothetical protein
VYDGSRRQLHLSAGVIGYSCQLMLQVRRQHLSRLRLTVFHAIWNCSGSYIESCKSIYRKRQPVHVPQQTLRLFCLPAQMQHKTANAQDIQARKVMSV